MTTETKATIITGIGFVLVIVLGVSAVIYFKPETETVCLEGYWADTFGPDTFLGNKITLERARTMAGDKLIYFGKKCQEVEK